MRSAHFPLINERSDYDTTQKAISFAVLAIALTLGFAGRWAEKQVETAPDTAIALRAEAMASRLFTLAIVFLVIFGLEFHSARTAKRFTLLEQEIEALRNRPASMSNQAMQLTAGRSETNFCDDFHIRPAAKLAPASGG